MLCEEPPVADWEEKEEEADEPANPAACPAPISRSAERPKSLSETFYQGVQQQQEQEEVRTQGAPHHGDPRELEGQAKRPRRSQGSQASPSSRDMSDGSSPAPVAPPVHTHFHFHCPAIIELNDLGSLPHQIAIRPLGRTRQGDTPSEERPPSEVEMAVKVCFFKWDPATRTYLVDCHYRSHVSEHLDVMGGKHQSDETHWETALREIAEESGVNVRVPEEVAHGHRDFVDAVYRALNSPHETAEVYLARHDGTSTTRCFVIRCYGALVSSLTSIPRSNQPKELALAVQPGWRPVPRPTLRTRRGQDHQQDYPWSSLDRPLPYREVLTPRQLRATGYALEPHAP